MKFLQKNILEVSVKKLVLFASVLLFASSPAFALSDSAKAAIEKLRSQTKVEEVATVPVSMAIAPQAEKTPKPVSDIDLKPDFTTIEAQRQYELLMGMKGLDLVRAREAAHYAKEGSPSYLRALKRVRELEKQERATKIENSISPSVYTGSHLSPGNYTLHVGPRGGVYHISKNGKKVYHSRRRR